MNIVKLIPFNQEAVVALQKVDFIHPSKFLLTVSHYGFFRNFHILSRYFSEVLPGAHSCEI